MPDDKTVEEFVRRLARAQMYRSHPLGFEDSLDKYWKEEAEEWVKEFDKPGDPDYGEDDPCPECGK
jgi:hypothetical protein